MLTKETLTRAAANAIEKFNLRKKLRERSEGDEQMRPVGGLGLVTCARIIKQHGGRVWGQSNPAGTTFHFTLPKIVK